MAVDLVHLCAAILHSIRVLLRNPWCVTLDHTPRERNSLADFMAKQRGSLMNSLIVFESLLAGVVPLLVADYQSVLVLRPWSLFFLFL